MIKGQFAEQEINVVPYAAKDEGCRFCCLFLGATNVQATKDRVLCYMQTIL
jgi:hypothetical protein